MTLEPQLNVVGAGFGAEELVARFFPSKAQLSDDVPTRERVQHPNPEKKTSQ